MLTLYLLINKNPVSSHPHSSPSVHGKGAFKYQTVRQSSRNRLWVLLYNSYLYRLKTVLAGFGTKVMAEEQNPSVHKDTDRAEHCPWPGNTAIYHGVYVMLYRCPHLKFSLASFNTPKLQVTISCVHICKIIIKNFSFFEGLLFFLYISELGDREASTTP